MVSQLQPDNNVSGAKEEAKEEEAKKGENEDEGNGRTEEESEIKGRRESDLEDHDEEVLRAAKMVGIGVIDISRDSFCSLDPHQCLESEATDEGVRNNSTVDAQVEPTGLDVFASQPTQSYLPGSYMPQTTRFDDDKPTSIPEVDMDASIRYFAPISKKLSSNSPAMLKNMIPYDVAHSSSGANGPFRAGQSSRSIGMLGVEDLPYSVQSATTGSSRLPPPPSPYPSSYKSRHVRPVLLPHIRPLAQRMQKEMDGLASFRRYRELRREARLSRQTANTGAVRLTQLSHQSRRTASPATSFRSPVKWLFIPTPSEKGVETLNHSSRKNKEEEEDTDDSSDPVVLERKTLWGEEDLADSERAPPDDLTFLLSVEGSVESRESFEKTSEIDDPMGYSGFHRLCNAPRRGPGDPRWQYVRRYMVKLVQDPRRAASELSMTQRDGHDFIPLHVVCMLSPPLDIVEDMIRLFPESLQINTAHGDSPLGLASGGFFPATTQVIETLVEAFPLARNVADNRGKTPIHNYLEVCKFFEADPYPDVVHLLITAEVAGKQDHRGHTPLWALGRVARVVLPHASERQFNNFKKSLEYILLDGKYKYGDSTSFLRDLRYLPSKLRYFSFENRVVKHILNDSMQRAPYTAILMMDFYVQLLVVSAFTVEINEGGNITATVMLLLGCLYWGLRRALSFSSSSNKILFILDPWRMLDLAHLIMLTVSAITLQMKGIDVVDVHHWRNSLIATSCLTWLAMMSILRAASRDFAVFVDAAIKITVRLFSFIMASMIVLTAFATMFYVSAVETDSYCNVDCSSFEEDCPREELNFCTLSNSMLKVYALFVGSIEESNFYGVPQQTVVLTGLYSFIVIILLLNIIIAIVTDAYEAVNKKAEIVFWAHRFDFLQEVDGFIHMLTSKYFKGGQPPPPPRGRDDSDSEGDKTWGGKTDQASVDWEGKKSDLFSRLIGFQSVTSLLDLAEFITALLIITAWIAVGLFSFGVAWPKSVRRFIFCPRISDSLEPKDKESEIADLKNEINDLRKNLFSVHATMEQILALQVASSPSTM